MSLQFEGITQIPSNLISSATSNFRIKGEDI
jgi:hypothetical protein